MDWEYEKLPDVWRGSLCRKCKEMPQSIGEMFLAKYSVGEWVCNKCYALSPQDNKKKGYLWIPNKTEEEEDE